MRSPWKGLSPSPRRSSGDTDAVLRHRDDRFFQTVGLKGQLSDQLLQLTILPLERLDLPVAQAAAA